MRIDSPLGGVVAVVSRRTAAFEPLPSEPVDLATYFLRAVESRRDRSSAALGSGPLVRRRAAVLGPALLALSVFGCIFLLNVVGRDGHRGNSLGDPTPMYIPEAVNSLNWMALSDCESGSNPQAVNPAGYYGLFQLSIPSWRRVGGEGNPIDALPSEQLFRAKLLYIADGAVGWGCGDRLLLEPASSRVDVNRLNWTALAMCESKGEAALVNPSGYYGLYQISLEDWKMVGGSGTPDRASPSEQLARAKNIYSRFGAARWACGGDLAKSSGSSAATSPGFVG
jgi:Transglycosylase-like domain